MAGNPGPVVKGWKYMSVWFGTKLDELADPRVQIEQAIQEAQRQHGALTRRAAAVIGNQRQLQMQLDRQLGTIEDLQAQTLQSLVLAERARADGDTDNCEKFERTAQAIAIELVATESSAERLGALHDRALHAAEQAREAVRTNSMVLQRTLGERSTLLSQLDQARMQETVAAALQQMSDHSVPTAVPTLDEVRDKIERRYAVALGQVELAQDCGGVRVAEVQRATLDVAGAARLAVLRAAMSSGSPGGDVPARDGAARALDRS